MIGVEQWAEIRRLSVDGSRPGRSTAAPASTAKRSDERSRDEPPGYGAGRRGPPSSTRSRRDRGLLPEDRRSRARASAS